MRLRPLVALVPLTVLAACGDDEEAVDIGTPEGIAAAADSSLEAGTAQVDYEITMEMLGQEITLTGEGQQDLANQRAVLTVDMSGMFEQLGAALPAEVQEAFAEPMEVTSDGSDLYMCGGVMAALGDAGCVHIDLADTVGQQAAAEAFGASNTDPAGILRMLQGAGEVEEVGTEDIDGVSTTRVRGTLTVNQALERLSEEAQQEFRESMERMGVSEETFDTPQDFEVWVGDDGLVYRIVQEMSIPLPTGESQTATMDLRFSEHGEPVDIEIPTDFVEAADLGLPGS